MTNQYDYYENYAITPKMVCDPVNNPEDAKYADKDDSLLPSRIIVNPTDSRYDAKIQLQVTTNYTVTRTPGGRIFLSYFSGGAHADEAAGNWCMVISSDDEGHTFQNRFVIEPSNEKTTRTFDTYLWLDESGKLWVFWSQGYLTMDGRLGVWVSCCENPDEDVMKFTAPRRIANGVMSTTPIITRNGEWIFPTYVCDARWAHGSAKIEHTFLNWLPEEQGVSVYCSKDQGETFERIAGNIRFPYSTFDEPSMVELSDGSLWMLIRGMNCVGETFSYDGGRTWTTARQNPRLNLPNTHFHLGKLKSGNLLLLANYKADMFSYFGGRNHLTALISRDDGATWEGFLMIDEREGSEQPGFAEGDNGFIYINYGRAPQMAAETCLAIVTEEDILAGKLVNPGSRLRIVAHKGTGMRETDYYESLCEIARQNNIEM